MNPGVLITLICLALVVAIAVGITRPVNLTLTIADGRLIVQPRGLDVLWTLRRCVEIPLDRVKEVRVVPRAEAPRVELRVPGTYVQGVIVAGSYGVGGHRAFWDVRRGDPVLVIECGEGAPYRTLVLEFAEPYSVLARVRGALGD
jgi:hypothetical protein